MTKNLSISKQFQSPIRIGAKRLDRRRTPRAIWLKVDAGLGLASGLLAGVAGFILTAAAWLFGNEIAASGMGKSATALIFAMIPLMALGEHCLDRIDALEKAEKIEFCRRHGLVSRRRR